MANTFAHIVFYTWPLVVVVLFRTMPLPKALCWAIVAGYLLLPGRVGFNISGLPTIDKTSIASLSAALMCLLLAQRDRLMGETALRGVAPSVVRTESVPGGGGGWLLILTLLALMVLSPVLTVFNNRETLVYGPRVMGGLTPWDMGSLVQGALITLVPFLLAMKFLATTERHKILLWVLVIAGLGYSLLAAVEIRLSPQMNVWVYGFFPHSFAQHFRAGGWRPVVFLPHGLWLAVFMAMAALSACVLWRQALRDRVAAAPWIMAGLWLTVILLLSNSLGGAVLVVLFAPVVLISPPRIQILLAAAIAVSVLVFPMLRGADLVPTQALVNAAERISPARAQSLEFRFEHEDMLLEKAKEKPLTGWGSWGRNRVFDAETGRDMSVTDGAWVIFIGTSGWLGYIARFGLLTLPLILMAVRRRDALAPATTGLALVAAVGLIDLIPNGTLTSLTWLVGGALAGRYLREERVVGKRRRAPETSAGEEPSQSDIPAMAHVRKPRTARGGSVALPQPGVGTARRSRV